MEKSFQFRMDSERFARFEEEVSGIVDAFIFSMPSARHDVEYVRADLPFRLVREAPGAIMDVTDRVRSWVDDNLRRFREAHPEGGTFDLPNIEFSRRYLRPDYDDNYNSERVNRLVLGKDGEIRFECHRTNMYYGEDLGGYDASLSSLIERVESTREDSGTNLYEVFKGILESADPEFKCEGTFGYLSSGYFHETYPHDPYETSWSPDSVLEMKNVLPLNTLMPYVSGFTLEDSRNRFEICSPSGQVLGVDFLVRMRAKMNSDLSYSVIVDDPRGILGLGVDGAVELSADAVLDRIRSVLFSPENLAKLAPCYESKGLPLPSPSSGRHVERSRDTERRSRSRDLYRRLSEAGKEVKSLKR